MQFCLADQWPRRWDISTIENISTGGLKFTVSNDEGLKDSVVLLQIMIQEWAPHYLEVEAKVLSVKPRFENNICAEVRAKFINLSEPQRNQLSIVERKMSLKETKEAARRKK